MDSHIKTRLLIILETHGMEFRPANRSLERADVAIHRGNLTDGIKEVLLRVLKGQEKSAVVNIM